ncbi:MAG: hypothetical protein GY847_27720 [Proteobacteria bacterium]|nr:hypothetical protein [Pseudomonadota bacterium]
MSPKREPDKRAAVVVMNEGRLEEIPLGEFESPLDAIEAGKKVENVMFVISADTGEIFWESETVALLDE